MTNSPFNEGQLKALTWRCIGPPRGGRVVAVAGHPTEMMTFYFGACAGGIWRTTDGGVYWENISDGFLERAAVGALTVAQSDPNVIYAGMGEATIRLDVSWGDGVYRSTDAGRTWANVGLRETRHIGAIRIHPQNPDIVYVAAVGNAFAPSKERGVFRSNDGGRSWEHILAKSEMAGAIDLAMDATNPRILYASIYECYRKPWVLSSGGPESGLWKSTDGGDSWFEITRAKGLPKSDMLGKIGVTISPANPDRVWAIIEAACDQAGVYRSDDGGATWEQLSSNRDLIQRPWYYCHIFADPQDADTVYINNLKMWKSTDGGKNYVEITTPHGDNHDLWIDPHNPQRMINGNDGGACVSFNGGATWSTIYNQMTSQFYHLDIDNQYPYRVYGTQQDNSSISVPSATEKGGIPWGDCYVAGTGESGYIAVHPQDPNIVYVGAVGSSPGGGGALQRYDHQTRQIRLVTVWPETYTGWGAGDLRYRFPWTFPICFSPHDPNILYSTGSHIFRSTDEGSSWTVISPDLTRADTDKLAPSGGPLTLDTSGAEHYCTLSAFVESPHQPGLLWAGSDDGLVHLSTDGGATWQCITPPELPEWTTVCTIELSPHEPATAYLAATRYKLGEDRPFLFKTTDYGKTWQDLSSAFAMGEITRVIRADHVQRGLLFVGTETGLFVSLDDGAHWRRLQNNLPVVPVYDLMIKGADLVVATHGRSFWILDDITPLRTLAAGPLSTGFYLYQPRTTVRQNLGWSVSLFRGPGKNYSMGLGGVMTFTETKDANGQTVRKMLDSGENPPLGVIIYYQLPDTPILPLTLVITDAEGNPVKSFSSGSPDAHGAQVKNSDEPRLPAEPGLNRFVWNMRYPDATKAIGDVTTEKSVTGPVAAPGRYQVRLTMGDDDMVQSFQICIDPRVNATADDLAAQFTLWEAICEKISVTHSAINRLRSIRRQVDEWRGRARGHTTIIEAAQGLLEKLTAIEAELVQIDAKSAGDRLRLKSRLNTKLIGLLSVVACADARPPQQAYEVFGYLASQVNRQLDLLEGIEGDDLAAFNDLVKEAGIPSVSPMEPD
ncbi:MAG: glycosyl hydrolase [Caldilineaceae bacterium]|nr:glycosyl hydrolase [Caldilineaceae bacterium]